MLHAFIRDNREELIARARARVAQRKVPRATQVEIDRGVPLFLTQLEALLRQTMTHGEESTARNLLETDAGAHGEDLLTRGMSVGQVVHDYGDVCQVVTELAIEREAPITADDFRAFNRCLDDAIAGAVTQYVRVRERAIAEDETERLGALANEMRNLIASAMLSFDTIRRGVAGTGGSVGEIHARSLHGLRTLVERSLTEVRLEAATIKRERVVVAQFIEEMEIAATIQARALDLGLSIGMVDASLVVEIDRHVMSGALSNLLHDAFKFTRAAGTVSLNVRATSERVCIDVDDECGDAQAARAEELFRLVEGRDAGDRSGPGRGLSITRRAVDANGGELGIQTLPGVGCRFTVDLPRSSSLYPGRPRPQAPR